MLQSVIEARLKEIRASDLPKEKKEWLIQGYERYLKGVDSKTIVGINDFLMDLPREEHAKLGPVIHMDLGILRRKMSESSNAKR